MIYPYNQIQKQPFSEKLNHLIQPYTKYIFAAYVTILGLSSFKIAQKILKKPCKRNHSATVNEPLDLTVEPLEQPVNEPLDQPFETVKEPLPAVESEDDENERIRQVMSELGKRSAVARAKKKELDQNNL